MGKTKGKDGPKAPVNARVAPDAVRRLDAIAKRMRPMPTRSQMVEAAILEYVERHEEAKQ